MSCRRIVGCAPSLTLVCPTPSQLETDGIIAGGSQPVEPKEPKLPSEAIELYNDFIHGEISRRAFMEGIQRLAGGLAAATVINALMPNYALGQQVSRTDDRIKAAYETVPSPKGNGSIKGYLVRP